MDQIYSQRAHFIIKSINIYLFWHPLVETYSTIFSIVNDTHLEGRLRFPKAFPADRARGPQAHQVKVFYIVLYIILIQCMWTVIIYKQGLIMRVIIPKRVKLKWSGLYLFCFVTILALWICTLHMLGMFIYFLVILNFDLFCALRQGPKNIFFIYIYIYKIQT